MYIACMHRDLDSVFCAYIDCISLSRKSQATLREQIDSLSEGIASIALFPGPLSCARKKIEEKAEFLPCSSIEESGVPPLFKNRGKRSSSPVQE